jgi:preprotein translocase subunit Sec63
MATGEEKNARGGDATAGAVDLYAVLGLNKECSEAELKNAYKKLALVWNFSFQFSLILSLLIIVLIINFW